jgi:hypothetical protein
LQPCTHIPPSRPHPHPHSTLTHAPPPPHSTHKLNKPITHSNLNRAAHGSVCHSLLRAAPRRGASWRRGRTPSCWPGVESTRSCGRGSSRTWMRCMMKKAARRARRQEERSPAQEREERRRGGQQGQRGWAAAAVGSNASPLESACFLLTGVSPCCRLTMVNHLTRCWYTEAMKQKECRSPAGLLNGAWKTGRQNCGACCRAPAAGLRPRVTSAAISSQAAKKRQRMEGWIMELELKWFKRGGWRRARG